MGFFDNLFGGGSNKAQDDARKAAKQMQAAGMGQGAAAGQAYGNIGQQAAGQGQQYDTATAAALAGGPQAYAQRLQTSADQYAQQQAEAEAARTTQQASRQAVKAARTAGALPGQAAFAAAQGAGDVYRGSREAAAQRAGEQYRQSYGQGMGLTAQQVGEMANRQLAAAGGQAGLAGTYIGGAGAARGAQGAAAGQAQQGLWQGIQGLAGGVGQIAGLLSDREAKADIRPVTLADALEKIRGFGYRYRGSDRPELGVMAQDVERAGLGPVVVETPAGKALDTERLTAVNTAGLGEHERRLKDIERILAAIPLERSA